MTVTPLPEWFATDIDLRKNQLLNARAQNAPASAPPADPVKGQLWFDTTSNSLKYWDGTAWTGGRTYYNTIADDGVARTQRTKLDFRSTASMTATVTDDGPNDTSGVTLDAKFGSVVASVIAGAAASDGTAATVARSDHSHGAPNVGGTDVSLTSWWQYSRELWEQLTAPATFIEDLPGETVGGGWQIGTNGSVYWEGDPIPVSDASIYRNSARVSALGDAATMSMGWLCYDADHQLLGQVKCSNQVPIVPADETGLLVSQNMVPSPSGEYGVPNAGDTWHSNSIFGGGTVGSADYVTDIAYTGSKSIRANWPDLVAPATQSNIIIACPFTLPPGTKTTLSAYVYVPAGHPDIRLSFAFFNVSPPITVKDQWVYVEVPFTTPSDSLSRNYYVGIYTNTPVAGTRAYLDSVMFRVGQNPLPNGRTYFDGDTVSVEDETFIWDGAPGASSSSYYTVEPSWEDVVGHLAIGDGVEPATGESAEVDEAVSPLPGTVYFRPFLSCQSGQVIVDTHEMIRSPRELRVVDGLETGWVKSDGPITAPEIVTLDVGPPDLDVPVPMRIGPVKDPPDQDGDVAPKAYVDRGLGLLPGESTISPRFLWSGAPGVDPQPADLGFPFAAWPLFAQWLDPTMNQSSITVMTGTYMGTVAANCPLLASGYAAIPTAYRVVTTPPADGVMVAISTGNANAVTADYLLLRCAAYSGVNDDGVGGAYVGFGGDVAVSSSGTASNRTPYATFSVVAVTAGTKYMFRTEYGHGGPGTGIQRDRVVVVYLPGAARLGGSMTGYAPGSVRVWDGTVWRFAPTDWQTPTYETIKDGAASLLITTTTTCTKSASVVHAGTAITITGSTTGRNGGNLEFYYRVGSGAWVLLATRAAPIGGGNVAVSHAPTADGTNYYVKFTGSNTHKSSGSAATTGVTVQTYKTVTTSFNMGWVQAYNGAGNKVNGSGRDGAIHQGYYSSTTGNRKSLVSFNPVLPAGAVVSKVIFDCNSGWAHWYYGNGGTISLGVFYSQPSKPATWGEVSKSVDATRKAVNTGSFEVDITSWAATRVLWSNFSGITIGPGPTTSKEFYGYSVAAPAGHFQLRITYSYWS